MNNATRSVLCLLPEKEVPGLEGFRQKYILHPGRDVPFHVTLLYSFYLPQQIDETIIARLKEVASETPRFEFSAKPLCSFPTTKVLYLSPVPATPLEALVGKLHRAFPEFYNEKHGLSIMHMTIALGNPSEATNAIVEEYFAKFGKAPLELRAGGLGIFVEVCGKWCHHLTIPLG